MRLAEPLALRSGLTLPNRIAKAAMTEQLCKDGAPNDAYLRLSEAFRGGGPGLVITGNMMVQRAHREHPRNVVVDDASPFDVFARLAATFGAGGPALVAQLSHPGRQAVYAKPAPVAPSAVPMKGFGPLFKTPAALDEAGIAEIVEAFAFAAELLARAGFAGVQVHAAHGYLISQFLSPRANQRTDRWGGSLENRARLLRTVVDAIRERAPALAILVKLNSADFQRGGFEADDALAVIGMLDDVDLLEISGGSYEAPAMTGVVYEATRRREAYFLDFADLARAATKVPLMVTGGFRTPRAMEEALAGGIDVIGLARPLALDPGLPRLILEGRADPLTTGRDRIGVRLFDAMLSSQLYVENLHRIAHGRATDPRLSRAWTIAHALWMSRGW